MGERDPVGSRLTSHPAIDMVGAVPHDVDAFARDPQLSNEVLARALGDRDHRFRTPDRTSVHEVAVNDLTTPELARPDRVADVVDDRRLGQPHRHERGGHRRRVQDRIGPKPAREAVDADVLGHQHSDAPAAGAMHLDQIGQRVLDVARERRVRGEQDAVGGLRRAPALEKVVEVSPVPRGTGAHRHSIEKKAHRPGRPMLRPLAPRERRPRVGTPLTEAK